MLDAYKLFLHDIRKTQVNEFGQLTLGQLIDKLKALDVPSDRLVCFDFCNLFPTKLNSFRGYYDELAIGYSDWPITHTNNIKLGAFLDMCQAAIGATYQGYKGGNFVMGADTPVWVANYGDNNNTMLIDVIVDYYVILLTGYQPEF